MSNLTTYEHIIQTAIHVFSQQGLSNVSFNALIRATGMSKGGVYHYFANKEEVILAIYDYFLKDFLNPEVQQAQQNQSAWYNLQSWVFNSIDMMDQLSTYSKLFIELFFHATNSAAAKDKNIANYQRFHAFIQQLLEQAKKDGDLKPELNTGLFTDVLMSISDGAKANTYVLGEQLMNSKKVSLYGIQLLFASITTEQGQKNRIQP